MKKTFLCMAVLFSFMITCNAETMLEIIEELPIKTEGEINYLELPIKDFDSVIDASFVIPSKEELIMQDPYTYENAPDSVFEEYYAWQRNNERAIILSMAIKQLGASLYHTFDLNVDFIDDNHIKLYKGNTKGHDYITVELRFDNSISENDITTSGQINNSMQSNYTQYGLTALNGIYHYGTVDESIYDSSIVLYRFPEFKNQLEEYPGYEIISLTFGAGGSPLEFGNDIVVGIVKNGKLLSIKYCHFSINTLLVVDEALEGNIFDKAINRLNEYFGENNYILTILDDGNIINIFDEGYYTDAINILLETNKENYDVYKGLIEFKNGNEQEVHFINAPAETVDKYNVISKDKNTGIMISTDSYDVVIDTFINVQDFKEEEFVKTSSTQNNIKYDYVYNIDLVRKTDGAFINTITNGVEVYIPIEDKNVGDIMSVYYIKEDSTIGEELQGEVVKIDNKLYVKFITNHFSVYAIGNKVEASKDNNQVENPQTYDGIINWLLLGIVSISGITGTLIYKKEN